MDSYGELSAEFYDLDKPQAPELALAWYANALAGRELVLEPMCGSGRFLLPLIKGGLRVIGFDPSAQMLARCRARLQAAGLVDCVWQAGFGAMGDPLPERPDAAFIPASSFCLVADPAAALAELRAMLAPGAVTLIEFELPHPVVNWPGETVRTANSGKRQIRLQSRVEYDARTQVESYTNRYELKVSGRVTQSEVETLKLRCYEPDEMRQLLENAGFTGVEIEHPEFGWVARATA